ncbi:hypothetical protein D9M70_512030 [compost metagenome]
MCLFCTREMDSRPPATAMSISSHMMLLAARAMLIRPEEHWRSTAMPETLFGSPAATAHRRPRL